MLAVSFAMLAACAARTSRQQDILFFPGPADSDLQEAARDAVLAVFKLHQVSVADAGPGAEVRGFKVVDCDDHPRVAYFRFAPSPGEQTVRVWMCPDGVDDCSTARRGSVPAACTQPTNRLVSSMETDLTNGLLARSVRVASAPRPWWEDISLDSMLALISVSHHRRPSLSDEWRLSQLAMNTPSRAQRAVVRRPTAPRGKGTPPATATR